jgi:arylsulfatase A-like enzyme
LASATTAPSKAEKTMTNSICPYFIENWSQKTLLGATWLFGFMITQSLVLGEQSSKTTNVVLIMADDLGWGETAYHGHPHLKTPTLDAMAESGLRLERFYAASPLCSPTRASVMTGRHANRSGTFNPNWSTRPEEITLAQVLKAAGYRTGHFGKWHLGPVKKESPVSPANMGFDEYLSHDNFFELNPVLSRNGEPPTKFEGESSEIVAAEASQFIERAVSNRQPFFTVLWFGSPHDPYSGLPEDVAKYADVPNPEMQHRFAEITAMDRAVGRLRDKLRALDVSENTLVWFNSDNGISVGKESDSFNGGWRGKKGEIFEGGLLVPGIVEWPSIIKSPRTSAVPCVTSDIFPTILDLLGLHSPDPPRPLDGMSLRELIVDGTMIARPNPIGFWKYAMQGENQNGRWIPNVELSKGTTPTTRNPGINFVNFKHPIAKTKNFGGEAAWTENQFKLISMAGKESDTNRWLLFDLLADPREKNDISEKFPDRVQKMKADLEAWQASVERSLTGADYRRR